MPALILSFSVYHILGFKSIITELLIAWKLELERAAFAARTDYLII